MTLSIKTTLLAALLLFLPLPSLRISAQTIDVRYEGAWTNITFGSTGKARVSVHVEGVNATINFDLDGFVFGAADPPLIPIPGVIQNGVLHLDTKGVTTYGDILGTIDLTTGDTLIDLSNVPNPNIKHVQLTGTVTANATGKIDLKYSVDFPGSPGPTNPAKGVLVASLIPPLQITSVQVTNGQLVVSWTGGKAPFQVQTAANLGASGWQNFGPTTSVSTAQIPLGTGSRIFVRVAGQ